MKALTMMVQDRLAVVGAKFLMEEVRGGAVLMGVDLAHMDLMATEVLA